MPNFRWPPAIPWLYSSPLAPRTSQVIEFLKTRGEKGAMILAINEMGDAHAHFGNWRGATVAWSDALDTLIGPYQV